ncbi:MAG: hypothetical protein DYG89_37130 [Caldilinea sp. CFX5]|nr:hypothetical protein [Caldilinea sp. CFX5]
MTQPAPLEQQPGAVPVHSHSDDYPILTVQKLLDNVADDLIAQHPAFLESILEARRQKIRGQVRRLVDLRQKYA